jgi:hypothetical protein
MAGLMQLIKQHNPEPTMFFQLAMHAEAKAFHGDAEAEALAEKVRRVRPAEADVILAHLRAAQDKTEEAAGLLTSAWMAHRTDPWPSTPMMGRSLELAVRLASRQPERSEQLASVLEVAFSTGHLNDDRLLTVLRLSLLSKSTNRCVQALQPFEAGPHWNLWFLQQRLACYTIAADPRAAVAERDLESFLNNARSRFGAGLVEDAAEPPPRSPAGRAPGAAPAPDPAATAP